MKEFNGEKFYTRTEIIEKIGKSKTDDILNTQSLITPKAYIHLKGTIRAYLNTLENHSLALEKYFDYHQKNDSAPASMNIEEPAKFVGSIKSIFLDGFFTNQTHFLREEHKQIWCLAISQTKCSSVLVQNSYIEPGLLIFPAFINELVNAMTTSIEIVYMDEVEKKRLSWDGAWLDFGFGKNGNKKFFNNADLLNTMYFSFMDYFNEDDNLIVYYYNQSEIIEQAIRLRIDIHGFDFEKPIEIPEIHNDTDLEKFIKYLENCRQTDYIDFYVSSLIEYKKGGNDTIPEINKVLSFLKEQIDKLCFIHDIDTNNIYLFPDGKLRLDRTRTNYTRQVLEFKKQRNTHK